MFIHIVFFWLKEGVEEKDLGAMEEGLTSLFNISTVRGGHWGKPANTPREVVDNSYSYALTVIFDDRAGHDAYQKDAQHVKLLEQCSSLWSKIKVYDYLTER
jgi:hypothetical protein